MNWLLQNWVWVVLAIGAVWMFSRGGLAGCGMGGHGGHGGHGGQSGPGAGVPPSADTAAKAIDPVSGREVLTAHAVTTAYQGRILYFENVENRQRFEAAPEQYARNVSPAPQHQHRGCQLEGEWIPEIMVLVKGGCTPDTIVLKRGKPHVRLVPMREGNVTVV